MNSILTDADVMKDRRSTDLFLKGLYLSKFERNHLNTDYRTKESPELPVRKRTIHSNNFPDMRNYNKLLVDYSKLATHDETKDIYKDYNFNGVKIISRFSFSSLNDTSKDTNLLKTTTTTTTTTTAKPSTSTSRDSIILINSASNIQLTKLNTTHVQPETSTKTTITKTTKEPFLIRVY